MKIAASVLTIALCLASTSASFARAGTFQEEDGIVVMEAESAGARGDWEKRTDNAGYTGECHLEFTGNGINGGDPGTTLTYKFKVSKDGNYRLHIRARKRLDGVPGDKCNDGYVRMSGRFDSGKGGAPLKLLKDDTKLFGGTANGWGWASKLDEGHKKYDPIYYFEAGETYTLRLSGRSIRWNIDRIVIVHEDASNKDALDPKRPESRQR